MRGATFATRTAPSALPELMDDPDLDEATLRACLQSLASVNRWSLGYRPTLSFVDRLAGRCTSRPLRLLDVGSGYGDTLRKIAARLARRGVPAELVGADLNPRATAIAQETSPRSLGEVTLRFVTVDARHLVSDVTDRFDAIACSLFTHHLEDDEVVEFVRFMDENATAGWLINDLYRSRIAASGFGALATIAGRHQIVRHDGPVSFARAFRRDDWRALLERAGVNGARVAIMAPFRLCVEKLA